MRLIKGLLATQTEEDRVGIKCLTSSLAPLLTVLSHLPQNLSPGQLGIFFCLKAEAALRLETSSHFQPYLTAGASDTFAFVSTIYQLK